MIPRGFYHCGVCGQLTSWSIQRGNIFSPICGLHLYAPPEEVALLPLVDAPWQKAFGGHDGVALDGTFILSATFADRSGSFSFDLGETTMRYSEAWVEAWPTPAGSMWLKNGNRVTNIAGPVFLAFVDSFPGAICQNRIYLPLGMGIMEAPTNDRTTTSS